MMFKYRCGAVALLALLACARDEHPSARAPSRDSTSTQTMLNDQCMFATAILYGIVQRQDTTPVQLRFRADQRLEATDGTVTWRPLLVEPEGPTMPVGIPHHYHLRLIWEGGGYTIPLRVTMTTRNAEGQVELQVPFTSCRPPSD